MTRHLLIGGLGGRLAGRFRVSSAGVNAVVGGLRTTFALREFAALVDAVDERMLPDDDPVKRAFELVERARMRRGLVRTAPEDLSIPDPMGRPPQAHHAAVRLVTDTVYRITRKIAPPRR